MIRNYLLSETMNGYLIEDEDSYIAIDNLKGNDEIL